MILIATFLILAAGLAGATGLALHHEAEQRRRVTLCRGMEWLLLADDGSAPPAVRASTGKTPFKPI